MPDDTPSPESAESPGSLTGGATGGSTGGGAASTGGTGGGTGPSKTDAPTTDGGLDADAERDLPPPEYGPN